MTNIEIIKEKLLRPSAYAFIPKALADSPLPFPEWEIQDEEGKGTGEYYSPKMLADILGSLLVLTPRVNGEYLIFRYGLDYDTINNVVAYLEQSGLNNVRKNEDGTLKIIADIDFTTFVGNEFMIVPPHIAKEIPITVAMPEEIEEEPEE